MLKRREARRSIPFAIAPPEVASQVSVNLTPMLFKRNREIERCGGNACAADSGVL